MEFDLSTIDSRETSYQTAPLIKYSSTLQRTAVDLFQRIAQRVGMRRAKQYKGSFSIFATTSQVTVAKIVIHEAGKGKMNGDDPLLANGVYILVRTAGNQNARARTIGVAPKHHERFAYFKLAAEQNLDEMADFIAACTLPIARRSDSAGKNPHNSAQTSRGAGQICVLPITQNP